MAKKMLIDATHAEETRVVVVDGNKVEEFDFESENKRQLAGNIYLAKVTRVEPSLQAAFVDYGGNRHGFLAFSEIHPDYYQIPVADREALMAEELAYDQSQRDDDDADPAEKSAEKSGDKAGGKPRRSRSRRSRSDRGRDGEAQTDDQAEDSTDGQEGDAPGVPAQSIPGMEMVDLGDGEAEAATAEVEDMNDPGVQRRPNADLAEVAAQEDAAEAPADDAGAAQTASEAPQDAPDTQSANAEDAPASDAETAADDAPQETPDDDDTPPTTMAARHDGPDAVVHGDVDAADDEDERPLAASDEDDDEDADDADDAAEDRMIESVADDDTPEDIRPPRKPRPRRYKIQEVIKVRQIMLVQVVKEERGNKGAALTTYLSLAGRYCVLMPNTARGGGISRKITNVQDRKKLKQIAAEIDVPRGAGLIVRTAGAKRTKAEIKRDYEYLQRLWEQIRELTLKSVAPAAIYAEGDLIKRSIRDLYNRDIDEVFVEGEAGYRTAKDFMKMIMPSHAKNVKPYAETQPLFARYQVESYLSEMFNPTVRLKSGGYIVIGVTEALVAVDVNSGKSTKEGSIEETALKTNLEAAEEVARQMRLRDLAGLIVIDFIDMDERKNNAAVEKRLKDKLKTDRARIQMGRISGFGLLEMSRQRLRPGMIEATTKPCPHCHGTGLVRSDDNLALSILRELEEEGVRNRSGEVLVKAPIAIANYLINEKREHIARIEMRYGMAVRVEADMHLISPDFSVEKFKTATRKVEQVAPVISIDMSQMPEEDLEDIEADAEEAPEAPEAEARSDARTETPKEPRGEDDDGKPKKKRRRRRRRRGGKGDEGGSDSTDDTGNDATADGQANDRSVEPTDGQANGQDDSSADVGSGADEGTAPADVAGDAVAAAPADDLPVMDQEPSATVEAAADPAPQMDADAPAAVDAVIHDESTAAEPEAEFGDPDAPIESDLPESGAADAAPIPAADDEGTVIADADEIPTPEAETVVTEQPDDALAAQDGGVEDMAQVPDAPAKPKKRGWWSVGG
ncbi:ribonuclease [Meridianimarinicoccus roseus]|uniref:Ribonuclease E n=1 Tax=Meridianimarinicoccus roseus TaxID=2072018 RepID=A0A2V2LBY5_9RHOB|nr:ribonuclease E/G [Meridianimarinicoccus roseus]PWR02948.1 ribonuclease [Meridianimarinicoccus roseus]